MPDILNKKTGAFTLAEVLVTLAVIGIVAALTIPSLIKNYQEKASYTKWKKEFSLVNQAVKMLEANNNFINTQDPTSLRTDFASVMKFIKQDIASNIFATNYYFYENKALTTNLTTQLSALTHDGTAIHFGTYGADCPNSQGGKLTSVCGYLSIDVNAQKEPNMIGKDMFRIWIAKINGSYIAIPWGSNMGDSQTCVNPAYSDGSSWGCSALALTLTPEDMP